MNRLTDVKRFIYINCWQTAESRTQHSSVCVWYGVMHPLRDLGIGLAAEQITGSHRTMTELILVSCMHNNDPFISNNCVTSGYQQKPNLCALLPTSSIKISFELFIHSVSLVICIRIHLKQAMGSFSVKSVSLFIVYLCGSDVHFLRAAGSPHQTSPSILKATVFTSSNLP